MEANTKGFESKVLLNRCISYDLYTTSTSLLLYYVL